MKIKKKLWRWLARTERLQSWEQKAESRVFLVEKKRKQRPRSNEMKEQKRCNHDRSTSVWQANLSSAPLPLQSETQLLASEGKKKVEANLVLKLFSNAGPINDLTFRERPRKLPESLSCFTSITQVKQQQQQQGKLWNMNIFVPWPFSFGPRFVVERCGRRIWKEAAATLVNIFTHKSLGVAMNRISDHWWPRQLSSRQSPIDGQEVLLGP